MHDNINDEKNSILKKEENKRKRQSMATLIVMGGKKKQLRKYEEKGKEAMCDNLDDELKRTFKNTGHKKKKHKA